MPARSKPPLGRRIQQRVFRVVNVPMRAVLGLPFATPPSRRLMLVFLTGRRTGKSYRQPVSYVRDGTVLLTPGGGKWKLNLTDGRPERIRLRRRDVRIQDHPLAPRRHGGARRRPLMLRPPNTAPRSSRLPGPPHPPSTTPRHLTPRDACRVDRHAAR